MKKCIFVMAALMLVSGTGIKAQNFTKTTLKLQGVEMVETMSDDGMSMTKRPYRWFAGMAEADVQSVAVEMAQLEAYATVSRVIENLVVAKAERGTVAVSGRVQKALKSHWEQMSMSIQKACEPFGDTEVTYNSETGLYEVIAKVGIRGDRYVRLLDGAKDAKPDGLSGDDLQQFIDINETIIDAAKGN
ncbi:MAG: hypothetical protein IJT39_05055 [Bacteroidales bacterium]|nr:hypothetical protein [Bacteroidales bacterium]